jgi:hypothetical protein
MSIGPNNIFDKLMTLGSPDSIDAPEAFRRIGSLIDLAGDLHKEDGATRALEWCDGLSQRKLTKRQEALLDYFRANAWANRQRAKHRNVDAAWQWEQPELQQQVFHLRRAQQSPGFAKLSPVRRCQIITNLGNQLSAVGRFVEARPAWTRALEVNPTFAMALGNRGYGLMQYARSLCDTGHKRVFLHFAYKDFKAALSSRASAHAHPDAKAYFAERKAEIEGIIGTRNLERTIPMDGYSLGTSKNERRYRQWVLGRGLFLNPLNDLGPYNIAARDILSLPTFTTSIDEPPSLMGLFDHMKQEFVSARWLLYEGLNAATTHFSDRQVSLYNTLDYPSYGLSVEKLKAAYRIAYSLLDKIAFFLNDYAKLNINERQIYFRTIWYENCDRNNPIRPIFEQSKNWPFRGLFWLSKDLFDPAVQDVMEPEAKSLYLVRNKLEHSYLKVHEILIQRPPAKTIPDLWTDRLAFPVQREMFEAMTLHVFGLARAALIYLSLGMHREEQKRNKSNPKAKRVSMRLDIWRDAWRR